jgi:AAHS family 4-hydroxybenzoate transporter-like MFS transporter
VSGHVWGKGEDVLTTTVNIDGFIDQRKVGRYQVQVLVLCVLMLMLDGFDDRSIAFVVPTLATDWGVANSAFGLVFSAGLLGAAVGALGFGALADRLGRKNVIIFCLGFFGFFTWAMVLSTSVTSLLVLKFIAGLGVGGFMPNGFAMIAEYAPLRRRALMVTIGGCGYSLGTVLPGLVAAKLFAVYGWQSMFHIGGIVPLMLVPVMIMRLPESIRFLANFAGNEARIGQVLTRIDPGFAASSAVRLVSNEAREQGVPIAHLLTRGRASSTLLLWVASFMDLSMIYYLGSWLPVVLNNAGYSREDSSIATSIYLAGGIAGAPLVGRLMDRFGIRSLAAGYGVLVLCILLFAATVGRSEELVYVLGFAIGILVLGGHYGVIALAGQLYPTFMRSTGVGWSLGIGRFCSISSPMLGGLLISYHWQASSILSAVIVPAIIAAGAIFLITITRTPEAEVEVAFEKVESDRQTA